MTAFDTSATDQVRQDGAGFDPLAVSDLDSASSGKPRPVSRRCCGHKEISALADEKDSTAHCSRCSTACCHQELEQEQIAAESAANEAISMILRLQAEKAALQIEARYYQDLFEARSLYDEQTISQLRDVISSQEEDIISLEREIDECKQALHILSDYMEDKSRQRLVSEGEDSCKISSIKVGTVLELYASKGGFKQIAAEKGLHCSTVHSLKNTQQLEFAPPDNLKEKAETKDLIPSNNSMFSRNYSLRENFPGTDLPSQAACLAFVDHYLRTLDLKGDYAVINGNCFGDFVKECWLAILMQFSNLRNQIWSLGLSKIGSPHAQNNCHNCALNYKDDACTDTGRNTLCDLCLQDAFHMNQCSILKICWLEGFDSEENKLPIALDSWLRISGLTQVGKENDFLHACNEEVDGLEKQKKPAHTHSDSWIEILTTADHCLEHLEEQFALFQSRLQGLNGARMAVVEAIKIIPQNKGILASTMSKSSNMLKECFSLAGLACDVSGIVHELLISLLKASKLEERCPNTDLGSQLKIDTGRVKENTFAAIEDWPGTAFIETQGNTPKSLWSSLSTLASVWSSNLEWLSDERCRAETALSGWDHV